MRSRDQEDLLLGHFSPKLTIWIPHKPTPKQLAYLSLPHKEALFGGAAGGGKSDALLMAALQYVDVPGYAAVIFRKTLTDLQMPGALLDRAHSWLSGTPARYSPQQHTYYFPTVDANGNAAEPAKLAFGYVGEGGQQPVYVRYQSAEFQFVGWDELNHHFEQDYLYLFSRLRKTVCQKHPQVGEGGEPIYQQGCWECTVKKSVPLRVRAATNPGGFGGLWIKKRFKIEPHLPVVVCQRQGIRPIYQGKEPERPFIASFYQDNPYIDQKQYAEMLDQLPELEKEQLKHGNWDAQSDARFKRQWVNYYSTSGDHFILGEERRGPAHPMHSLLKIFTTVDPAGSSREGPGDIEVWQHTQESYTVISTWGITRDYNLLFLDMIRFRKEIPEINAELKACYRKWRPAFFKIEANGLGMGVYQLAQRAGLPVKKSYRHSDKVVNATDAILRMEQGRVWFPQQASWLKEAEDEIFSWIGHPKQTDDVVDTLADAAKEVSWEAAADEQYEEYSMEPADAPTIVPPQGTWGYSWIQS